MEEINTSGAMKTRAKMPSIHPELSRLMRRQSEQERKALTSNLLSTNGPTDPILIWEEEGVVLDGHNRLEICEEHDLPYQIATVSLPDTEAAKLWMLERQIGRRNLSPQESIMVRGQHFDLLKTQREKADPASSITVIDGTTAEQIAEMHGCSVPTADRSHKFWKAVQKLGIEKAVRGGAETRTAKEIIRAAFPPPKPEPPKAPASSSSCAPSEASQHPRRMDTPERGSSDSQVPSSDPTNEFRVSAAAREILAHLPGSERAIITQFHAVEQLSHKRALLELFTEIAVQAERRESV